MYESMLSRVPLYSVWPHFRRIIICVPTLYPKGQSSLPSNGKRRPSRAGHAMRAGKEGQESLAGKRERIPCLQVWPWIDGLDLESSCQH